MMIFPDAGVITRQCSYKAYLETQFCKTATCLDCNKDECNGAAQYGPAAIIVTIPIAIMKIFSLL